jgi:parvulin-like peptidyl-prolyl isomerase
MNAAHPMKVRLLFPLLVVALLVAACGSKGSKLDAADIAVVGSQHITLEMFNSALAQEKASLKAAGQTVPAAGSTQFASLKTNIVDVLVQRAEFASEAAKLGISVSDKEVQTEVDKLKTKYFAGSQSKYLAALKQQGFTDADVRSNLREQVLERKLYNGVTKDAKATKAEIAAYYQLNRSQYQQAASRKVREILVGKNKEKLAKQIYAQVKAGGDFAALAKKHSQDPGSKNSGGNFTAKKGTDVPEFDKAVFAPGGKSGDLLQPVNTSAYGWFVIQLLGPIVPAKTTTEADATPAIRKQLNATKQQQALSDWLNGVTKSFCSGGKIEYQTGYQPSPDPCASLAAGNATTT